MDAGDGVYLPSSTGYRSCYYRYMDDQGYSVRPKPNEDLTIKWKGDSTVPKKDRTPYISQRTYVRVWKRDYSHLKVSKPVEDICELCYKLANRHKYLAQHTCNSPVDSLNSGADAELFRGSAEESPFGAVCQPCEPGEALQPPAAGPAAEETFGKSCGCR